MSVPGVSDGFASVPSMRRVYDYWLGGRDNFAADRAQAHRIEDAYPPPREGELPAPRRNIRCNRAFLERAVKWAAGQGCGQFAQLCAGPPPPPQWQPLHEVARDVTPGARFAYTDGDPVTVSLLRAHSHGQDVAIVEGRSDGPDTLLAALKEAVDLGEPCCLILSMILQHMRPRKARETAAAYVAALAPGSFLVISNPRCDPPPNDPGLWDRVRTARACSEVWNHGQSLVRGCFTGTTLVPPGLVPASAWHPDRPAGMAPGGPSYILAGVGRKR